MVYDDSYTNEYVKLRAKKTYGERRYNILGRNCEHSTRWCKTGIRDSRQVEVCFTTTGKATLVVVLRVFSMIVLWLLQLADEFYKGCARCERVVSGVYMAAIACLFIVYSLYRSGSEIRPKVPSLRRGVCSGCCKDICGRGTMCRRHPSIIIGLFLRIFLREGIAAVGPFLIVYFEDQITVHLHDKWGTFFAILALIVGASLVAYLVGALVGVLVEALIICCAGCSCCCSSPDDDGGNRNENAEPVAQPDVYWL